MANVILSARQADIRSAGRAKARMAIVLALILAVATLTSCSGNSETPSQTETNSSPDPAETAAADPAAEKAAAYAAEPASSRTIHIAYDGGLCQAAIPIAQFKGFLEAEGIVAELTKTGGTQDNTRDALVAGKIDTAAGMIAGWLKPITNGVDIRFSVGLHTGCASAFVLADSSIQSFADAKGKTVAINGGIGGIYHNIGYRFIAHDGFVPEDFTWKDFPADQTLLILQKGEADVAVFSDQLAEQWVQDGTLRRIRSLHEDADFADEACCVFGFSGAFLDENPITAEKVSRAVYNAALWIGESDANKEEAAQILLDNGYISGTKEYAVSLMKLFRWGLPNDLTEATLNLSVTDYQDLGVISAGLDPVEINKQVWAPLDIE
ncbi:MAG: ABC transporter substrate-binding protein [Clostridiales Family XIII bacterium]|jgi:NitT/TauT family transport system substrate-binding protein|nr:ABC transporter substrate-binding protein [Clostridiales Family XIII bacterium]